MIVSLAIDAPWGPIEALVDREGVLALTTAGTGNELEREAREDGLAVRPLHAATGSQAGRTAARLLDALAAYLDRRFEPLRTIPIAWHPANDFDRRVMQAVRTIPSGQVTSYGRLARRAGHPGAARAVGGAMRRNRVGLLIPCHRVIAGDGTLGGYGGDPFGGRERALSLKLALLEHEGVTLPALVEE